VDRALDSGSKGQGFKSSCGRHIENRIGQATGSNPVGGTSLRFLGKKLRLAYAILIFTVATKLDLGDYKNKSEDCPA
jgi:hypothetical protein